MVTFLTYKSKYKNKCERYLFTKIANQNIERVRGMHLSYGLIRLIRIACSHHELHLKKKNFLQINRGLCNVL